VEFIFVTSEEEEEEFICQVHSLNLHEFDMSLNDERVQRSEEFRTGVANKSEGDIMDTFAEFI
jgi:hypothetical protein